jgi:hypothetical protein
MFLNNIQQSSDNSFILDRCSKSNFCRRNSDDITSDTDIKRESNLNYSVSSSCISACLTFDEADDPSCTDLNCMCHYILQGGPICSSCILEKENLTKAILAGELISTCLSLSLLNMESTIGANTATMTASVTLSIAGVASTSSSRSGAGSGGVVIDVMIVYAIEITAVVAGLMAVFI